MRKSMNIQSRSRAYTAEFVNDYSAPLQELLSNPNAYFLVDQSIYRLYSGFLKKLPFEKRLILLEAVEPNKTIASCEKVIDKLLANKANKRSILVILGGGILQDVGAFVSSILFRGIRWFFFPTTLLAQADSCIGSKTSINFRNFKNLIGNFYPPSRIFIDVNFLKTLSEKDIKSGIGEILHYYLIAGSPYIDRLNQEYCDFFSDRKKLIPHIHESLRIKKGVIEKDEFDQGKRNLFNYGHTFGHALESVTGYQVSHGQAITAGMDMANYLSFKMKLISPKQFKDMHQALSKNLPSKTWKPFSMAEYIKALSKDKKNVNANLTCILTRGPGRMEKRQVPMDSRLRSAINEYFNRLK
ncbi:MAG: 3-dehydroquinate synthase [Candidatus Omnitrophica bacterium]|nr:3-dehydroquinate synthase [Candidatus Omnitrophota bacterium]